MYWGQLTVGLVTGAGVGIWWLQTGHTGPAALAIGLLVFIGSRWLLAWLFRSSYWLGRGTRNVSHRDCPDCSGRIHRRPKDWILTCHRCGWQPGWPGVRWLLHSVPAVQFRRTVVGPLLLVAVVLVAVLVTGAADQVSTADVVQATGAVLSGFQSSGQADAAGGDGSTTPITSPTATIDSGTPTVTTTPSSSEYPVSVVETHFLEHLNEERAARDVGGVTAGPALGAMAVSHSRAMARAGQVAHDGIGDGTVRTRFDARGLTEECRWIAENAASNWVGRTVRADWATGGTFRVDSPEDLAYTLFQQWLHSPPHRRAMLSSHADRIGLGFVVTDSGQVFAALELCGLSGR